MMRLIYKHILARVTRLLVYFLIYIIVSISIIIAFGFGFKLSGLNFGEAVIISFHLFYGIESNTIAINSMAIALEYITRDIIFVAWVGSSLSGLLSPVNPIYYSDVFTYNSDSKVFSFRYWLMLKSGRFLYDLEIRVFVQDYSKQTGRNHMATLWEWTSESQHLSLARGIRYIDILDVGAQLSELLFRKKQTVTIMLRGTDENGKIFYRARSYTASDCRCNQKFISVLKDEYCKLLNLDQSERNPHVQFDFFNKTYNEASFESKPKVSRKKIQNKWFSFWLYTDTPCWERVKQKLAKKR